MFFNQQTKKQLQQTENDYKRQYDALKSFVRALDDGDQLLPHINAFIAQIEKLKSKHLIPTMALTEAFKRTHQLLTGEININHYLLRSAHKPYINAPVHPQTISKQTQILALSIQYLGYTAMMAGIAVLFLDISPLLCLSLYLSGVMAGFFLLGIASIIHPQNTPIHSKPNPKHVDNAEVTKAMQHFATVFINLVPSDTDRPAKVHTKVA